MRNDRVIDIKQPGSEAMGANWMYQFSNRLMVGALFIGIAGAWLAYGGNADMGYQVLGHIGTIVSPALLKLGYVGRMAACRAMGVKVDC